LLAFQVSWGIFFILAGAFGLVSAFLLEEDEHLSKVFNLVSVHLFLLDAVGLLT
jgi:predicted outer membrane lipoprotein